MQTSGNHVRFKAKITLRVDEPGKMKMLVTGCRRKTCKIIATIDTSKTSLKNGKNAVIESSGSISSKSVNSDNLVVEVKADKSGWTLHISDYDFNIRKKGLRYFANLRINLKF